MQPSVLRSLSRNLDSPRPARAARLSLSIEAVDSDEDSNEDVSSPRGDERGSSTNGGAAITGTPSGGGAANEKSAGGDAAAAAVACGGGGGQRRDGG